MTWVAVGVAGAGLVGSYLSSNAASSAANAQTNAANNANATTWNMYQQTRNDQLPWRQAGEAGLGQLMWLLGLPQASNLQTGPTIDPVVSSRAYAPNSTLTGMIKGGGLASQHGWEVPGTGGPAIPPQQVSGYDPATFGSLTRPFSMDDFQKDPGYAFRMQQGLDALDRSGAAAGSRLSGGQMKALMEFGQGLGSQEYGDSWNRWHTQNTDIFNRFASLAGLGQQANSILANVGMNTANNLGSNMLGAGNAAAAGIVGSANAWGSGLNNAANAFAQNYYLQNGGWGTGGQAILNRFGNGPGGWNAPQTIPVS